MAIAPTGAIYKALSFDNTSSRNYGVYITGEAVYNAPERDVEMIDIPGRNGAYALDHKRFQNIEVTYFAGITADTEANFRQAISDFRNFLCSKKGYVRLSDDYNPDEYRMAIYKSGLEVTPAQLRAGEFDITFECKPQRFLTSGENKVTVSNNGSITNPTLFSSSPLIEVTGYGNLNVGGYPIKLINTDLGYITVANASTTQGTSVTLSYASLSGSLNSGNTITIPSGGIRFGFKINSTSFPSVRITEVQNTNAGGAMVVAQGGQYADISLKNANALSFTAYPSSTASQTINDVYSVDVDGTGGMNTLQVTASISISNSHAGVFTITLATSVQGSGLSVTDVGCETKPFTAYSTVTGLGSPTYIDCEIGEAYKYDSGNNLVSLNKNVVLGGKLPELAPGSTTVTRDNTITKVEIVPRWWKV